MPKFRKPGGLVPQAADHGRLPWPCADCLHDLVEHPAYYPRHGTPSMPCRVPGCACVWFSDICQECSKLRPCAHWSEDRQPIHAINKPLNTH